MPASGGCAVPDWINHPGNKREASVVVERNVSCNNTGQSRPKGWKLLCEFKTGGQVQERIIQASPNKVHPRISPVREHSAGSLVGAGKAQHWAGMTQFTCQGISQHWWTSTARAPRKERLFMVLLTARCRNEHRKCRFPHVGKQHLKTNKCYQKSDMKRKTRTVAL